MIITTIEEMQLAFPAHALDSIEALTGFIDNSENDFLKEKLGATLYEYLLVHYRNMDNMELIAKMQNGEKLSPWEELIRVCQRCVAFDAMGRAASVQAISINNAGLNVSVSNDYSRANQDDINAFKRQCGQEAHSAINQLLQLLEDWYSDVQESSDEKEDDAAYDDSNPELTEKEQKAVIVGMWAKSRYYFLVTSLLIPSARTLQQFFNIYDNREKFIQMLPDLHYIQDELIAASIGEDFCEELVKVAIKGTDDKVLNRIINKLQRALAAELESRTSVVSVSKVRQSQAHDEYVGYMCGLAAYIPLHQKQIEQASDDLAEAIKTSPLYAPEMPESSAAQESGYQNESGKALFVLPDIL